MTVQDVLDFIVKNSESAKKQNLSQDEINVWGVVWNRIIYTYNIIGLKHEIAVHLKKLKKKPERGLDFPEERHLLFDAYKKVFDYINNDGTLTTKT